MEFIGLRAAKVGWKVSSLPFERELFESIFRVIMIFFFSVVDSNTCDKIRTIRARITCNNAKNNIDLRCLKGYYYR